MGTLPIGSANCRSDVRTSAGYAHPKYAAAFSEWGTPTRLSFSQADVLLRQIDATGESDAMGLYPLFCCGDWARLGDDLSSLGQRTVSITVVTDPFGEYDEALLRRCFPDLCRPFKEHFIIDLRLDPAEFICAHHRRNVTLAKQDVLVERLRSPMVVFEEWLKLYGNLCERHKIAGMQAFSRASFEAQFSVPGLVAFRASVRGEAAGIVLWYVDGQVAYYHLGAYNDLGYESRASFALFRESIDFFRGERVNWLGLGAGAGLQGDSTDGLSRFKAGWSTGTRTAYLCGRIFDRNTYDVLSGACASPQETFFPRYRAGEFRAKGVET